METNDNVKSTSKAKKGLPDFFKQHKKSCLVVLGIILGVIIIGAISVVIRNNIEENRDYYISVDKEYAFDCNASYDEKTKEISCEEQTITGKFSEYPTVKIDGYITVHADGDKFSIKPYNDIYKSRYETDDFDIEKLEKGLSTNYIIYLENTQLNKRFAETTISVRYKLSEADKELITKKHNDWKEWKESEDAKAKAESETKEQEQKQETKPETSTTTSEERSYLDALRKCTVMEAADIYTTGIGKKSDNVFNDGRDTCNTWYSQWGEDDFFEAVYIDWENRKTEEIDGQPLTYYLTILGW